MGKRSNFPRHDKDFYRTFDPRAYPPLVRHLAPGTTFYEPCRGDGDMIRHLEAAGMKCTGSSDLPKCALTLTKADLNGAEMIITNPVWSRPILHKMILHFTSLAPTWLLFDANWTWTKQAKPYFLQLSKIVSVGRLTWIPGTTMSGKDDCAWFHFTRTTCNQPPRIFPR